METLVLTIHILIALALIGSVLLQRSEGGGLGIGGGGAGGRRVRDIWPRQAMPPPRKSGARRAARP